MKKSFLLLLVCFFSAFLANALSVSVPPGSCMNGGIWVPSIDDPNEGSCECTPGWTGDRCEIPLK